MEIIIFILFTALIFFVEYHEHILKLFRKKKKINIEKLIDMPDIPEIYTDNKLLSQQIRHLTIQINTEFEIVNDRISKMFEKMSKTDNRVNELEDMTDFIKVLKKYKWLLITTLIGVYTVLKSINIQKLIDLII